MLLSVENFVGNAVLRQFARQQFRFFYRRGTEEHGLPRGPASRDILNDCGKLLPLSLEDHVGAVEALRREVCRNWDNGEAVGVGKLRRFSLGRSGHTGQLVVHAEVVLQRHRRPGVVFVLDTNAFLGFDRLMKTITPATTIQGTSGEFINDFHFPVGDEVVLVAVPQFLGLECLGQLVHLIHGPRVVQIGDAKSALHLFDARFGNDDRALFFVHFVIRVLSQGAGNGGELVVELGRFL